MSQKNLKIRTRFDRKRVAVDFPKGSSMTKKSFAADADINNVMKKFRATGQLPQLMKNPQYGDFSDVSSYQESLDTVMVAQTQFAALPAHVRERFQNDPSRFLAFVGDEKNLDEMVKLGLADVREPSVQGAIKDLKDSLSSKDDKGRGTRKGATESPQGDDA